MLIVNGEIDLWLNRREMTRTISLAGTTLELIQRGQRRSLLLLHAGEGLAPERP